MSLYLIVSEAHSGLAMLSIIATLAWAVAAWLLPAAFGVFRRAQKLTYVAAMASTGLTGLSGLGITALGGWWPAVFPWLGLAAVVCHGIAGVRAKKALLGGSRLALGGALVVQIAVLVGIFGLMTVKPF